MRPLLVAALFFSAACRKEKPVAPEEMTDLVIYMFANFEDPEAMAVASDNMKAWLDDHVEEEQTIDGYQLEPLTKDDLGDSVDYPNNAVLSQLLGAAGGNVSSYALEKQANHMVVKDQTFANEKSYNYYDRTVTEGGGSFQAGSGVLRTVNDVETNVLIYNIPYDLKKDYRWVTGEESKSIIGRSWIEEEGCTDGGGTCLLQSFSVDVFMESGKRTQRLTATWAESKPTLGEDFMVASLADGLQDVFEGTDAWLESN